MNLIRFFRLVGLAIFILVVLTCHTSPDDDDAPPDGVVEAQIDEALDGVLTFSDLTVQMPGQRSLVGVNGAVNMQFHAGVSDSLQSAIVMVAQDTHPVLFSVVFSDNSQNPLGARPELGARSTALALVMMNPLFMGAHDQARVVLAEAALKDAGFSGLVSEIETALASAATTYLDTTSSYTGLYTKAADIALRLFDAQGAAKPAKRAVADPYLEMGGANQARIINPTNIHFGVGINHYDSGGLINSFMLRQCGLKWGWFDLDRVNTVKTKTIADGRYTFAFFRGFNFETQDASDVLNPLHPAGLGTYANAAQMVLNLLDVAGTEFVDNESLEILLDNANRLSGLTALGEALAAGDVVTFMDKGILFLYDNLAFIAQLLMPDMDADELADYLGPITNQLKNLAAPLKVKNALEKLPFFKDLVFASDYVSYAVDIENGQLTTLTLSDIVVTEPDGATVWTQGKAQAAIRWETGNLPGDVFIDLYRGNDLVDVISNGAPNVGFYTDFDVPDTLRPGDNYRVQITPVDYPSRSDFGAYFTVAANSADPYEPNDTRYQAVTLIPSGEPAVWHSDAGTEIHAANDQDWFAFEVAEGDVIEIHCDVTSSLDAQVRLYYYDTAAGADVLIEHHDASWSGGDEIVEYEVPNGKAGTYYFGIGQFGTSGGSEKALAPSASTGSYALTVTLTPEPVDPYEPNNDPASAYAITLSGSPLSWESGEGPFIEPDTDQDWFFVDLEPGDEISVTLVATSQLNAEIVLYHAGRQVEDTDDLGNGGSGLLVYSIPSGQGGSYQIGIGYYGNIEKSAPHLDRTGTYELVVQVQKSELDPYEPNDDRTHAYPVALSGSPLTWESGSGPKIEPSTDQDWYAVTLSANDEISVWIDVTSDLNPEIVLYYNGSQVEDTDDLGSGQDGVLTYTVPSGASGVYYAGVGYYANIEKPAPRSANTGTYELAIDVTRSSISDPYEPNDTPSEATHVYPQSGVWNSNAGTAIDPEEDQDWFQLSLSAGEVLNVICDVTSNLDAEIVLYYHGTQVKDRDSGGSGSDEVLIYNVPAGDWGTYIIGIGYYGHIEKSAPRLATTGSYALAVQIEHPSIVVTQPVTGTIWNQGQQNVSIRWETQGFNSDVMIELNKGGSFDRDIVTRTANDGVYDNYDVPSTLTPGTDYRIEVTPLDYPALSGYSGLFSVAAAATGDITVIEPSSSTVWIQGQQNVPITWDTGNLGGNVRIDIYKGSSSVATVMNLTANDGSFDGYDVGTDLTPGSDYRVKVTLLPTSSNKYDYSDDFTIESSGGQETGTLTDIDGNVYQTVKIGNQWWMAEDLRVTHYRNGDAIPKVTTKSSWEGLSTGGYCVYDNDDALASDYGYLYNWFVVDDSRNVAPSGWHVPTVEDWEVLVTALGGETVAGGKMKEAGTVHWNSPNTGADNSSGFTARAGGFRWYSGNYQFMMERGYYWTSEESVFSSAQALQQVLLYNSANMMYGSTAKRYGLTIRLVKD